MWTLLLALAFAEDPEGPDSEDDPIVPDPVAGWAILELRGGVQGIDRGGNVMLCGELSPVRYVAIEACGSGAGFLFDGTPTELVHFRAEGNIPLVSVKNTELVLQPGIGFAELEAGADAPGFLFGPARTADQREGAGVEGSLSAKGRLWAHEKVYLSAEAGMSLAHIPSAPVVIGGSPTVFSAMSTIGLGF